MVPQIIGADVSFDLTIRTEALHSLQAIIVAADQAQRTQRNVDIQWMEEPRVSVQGVCSSVTRALNLHCCWQVVEALNQSMRVANRVELVDATVGTIMAMATALGGAFDNLADRIVDSILMKSGAYSA